ncbi:hypothetical protein GQ600_17224 [Phytophthora cactorum]|nr:hypothetical protein GQ600_17224 [Phytophthora cactorum]
MNRRSSSTSLQRQIDFTKTVPFVPREVFRLVLRLEAQKALEVNVAALEQRFRVPPGYADDDSLNARVEFTPGTPSSRLVQQHSNLQEDGDAATHETVYTAKPKDVRIKVSCRMPGGMLITASVYSMKKLRHFKSAILLRQKRFQSVDQFDLYHMSGRKLTGLEETLVSCGVRDRSMLQIVPAVTVALTPLGNTTGNQEPSNTR